MTWRPAFVFMNSAPVLRMKPPAQTFSQTPISFSASLPLGSSDSPILKRGKGSRSTMPTRRPPRASAAPATVPAGPAPMMWTSKLSPGESLAFMRVVGMRRGCKVPAEVFKEGQRRRNRRLAKARRGGNFAAMSRVPPAETTASRSRVGPAVRLAALTAFIAAGILLMLRYGSDPTAWFAGAGTCPPALFFALVALLPLFGFPLAPLYVFAGAVYGVRLGLPLTLAGIAVHLCLAYPFYGVLLREPASRLLAKRGYRLPEFAPKNRLRATFLIASVRRSRSGRRTPCCHWRACRSPCISRCRSGCMS